MAGGEFTIMFIPTELKEYVGCSITMHILEVLCLGWDIMRMGLGGGIN